MPRTRPYGFLLGVGGIGSGEFWQLRGNRTLGRSESRAARRLRRRDFCKLHIVAHYLAVLTGAGRRGFTVLPVGKVGDDPAGREMLDLMRRAGMDTRFVAVEPAAATLYSVCFVYPDGDGGNITTDDSASARVGPADVRRAVEALPQELAGADGIALAVPEVPLEARAELLEAGRRRGWLTAAAVTTAETGEALRMGMFARADLVSMNREEAAALVGAAPAAEPAQLARAAGQRLAEDNPRVRLCVTAGAEGSFGWTGGELEHTPACPVEAVNTAGAGDATLAGLILATAAGLPFIDPRRPRRRSLAEGRLETALDLAALLAGLAVRSEDTIDLDADADALRRLAREIGADAAGIEKALQWP